MLAFHLHCVNSSSFACPPPLSSQFERNRSSTLHHVIRVQTLVSHPNQVLLSVTHHLPPTPRHFACVPLSPCPLEPDRSSPTPTVSIRAQLLVCHLHRVLSGPIACLPLPPCQFGHNCSSPTPTVSLRAQPLVSHLDCVPSGPSARLSPGLCLFKFERICHPYCVPSSPGARLPP